MPYAQATYDEILCWMENTPIEYVPNGKKAGTKSFDRYEKYSQATTVGKALEFGSLPLDLVNDFEKKLLKRIGSPVRDAPLNPADVQDPAKMTHTDRVIFRFGHQAWRAQAEEKVATGGGDGSEASDLANRKEAMRLQRKMFQDAAMAAKNGTKPVDVAKSSINDSADVLASRSKANDEAASILEAAASEGRHINDDDVLRLLRLWTFKKNQDRKNVMPEGNKWVHSETIGLQRLVGNRMVATKHVQQYPKFTTLLSRWMKDNRAEGHDRDFPFTTIIINSGFSSKRHRDQVNTGPSVVKAFGDFEGGRLQYWAEDDKTHPIASLLEKDAQILDVRAKAAFIDGIRSHEVQAYTGDERFSMVFLTTIGYEQTSSEVQEQLAEVGIQVPDDDAVNSAKSLLPLPKGYEVYNDKARDYSKKSSASKQIHKGKLLSKIIAAQVVASTGTAPAALKGADRTNTLSRGLLARVLATREKTAKQSSDLVQAAAPTEPKPGLSGQSPSLKTLGLGAGPVNIKKKVLNKKPQSFGGLLARVQKRSLEGPPSPAAAADPGSPVAKQGDATPLSKRPRQSSEDTVSSMELSGKKLDAPAQKKATADEDMLKTPDARKVPAGGILARVLQGRTDAATAEAAQAQGPSTGNKAAAEMPSVPGARKIASGGLLARVQAKAEVQASPAAPSPAAPGKAAEDEPMRDASETRNIPKGGLLANVQGKNEADTVGKAVLPPAEPQLDDACQRFLAIAGVLSTAGGEAAEASKSVADCLVKIARSATHPEEALSAAMVVMEPAVEVPAGPLAEAIAEAFGVPCGASLLGEALAAKALEGRAQKIRPQGLQALSITEVAKVLAAVQVEPQALVGSLVKLLDATEPGMEPFYLVRALQGKLAPGKEVVRRAVSAAMVHASGR